MQTHRFDILSFTSGLLFFALGAVVLVADVRTIDLQAQWLVPVLALVAGAGFLASAMRRTRPASTWVETADGWVEEAPVLDPEPIED